MSYRGPCDQAGIHLDRVFAPHGIETLEARVKSFDDQIASLYEECDPEQALREAPGIGEIIAPVMSAFIGDIRRFRSAKAFAAWFGYIPRTHQTGGDKGKPQRMTKAGPRLAKQHIFLAADVARHHDPKLALTYKLACDRGKHHVDAVCIVGHKLLRKIYGFLTRRAAATGSESPVRWRTVDPTTGADVSKQQAREWINQHCPSKAEQKRRAPAELAQPSVEETAAEASDSESLMKSAAKTSRGDPTAPTVPRCSGCGQPVESAVGKLLRQWAEKLAE